MKPAELKKALVGPIVSLPTFFTQEGAQDLESVRSTVEFAIKNDMSVPRKRISSCQCKSGLGKG